MVKAAVDSIRLIDTHEHQVSEELWLAQKIDLFYWLVQPWGFTQNTDADLLGAGMSEEERKFIMNPDNQAEERWSKLAPWWSITRFTSYARPVRIAARDLFGFPDIDSSTWLPLNEKIISSCRPGYREYLFRDKAGIDLMILDRIVPQDYVIAGRPQPHTVLVKRFDDYTLEDNFVTINSQDVLKITGKYRIEIRTIDDLLLALDRAFEETVRQGSFVSLKSALAYDRVIRYEDISRLEAGKIFNVLLTRNLSADQRRPFEDFMMHEIFRRAGKYGFPVQIHTGAQLGPGNDVTRSRPDHLIGVISKYPETRFVLLHGGFPYTGETTFLVKNYPNVYLDMCLMPVYSMSVAREWLHIWLETLPVNKINVFGGDCLFPEGTYGHSIMARQVVTEVLCEMIESGSLSFAEAEFIARRILRENAIELYGLRKFLDRK